MKTNESGILAGASVNGKNLELLRMECLKFALQAASLSTAYGVAKGDATLPNIVGIAQEFERYVTGDATGREAG